jgi:hypothetical protein
MAEGPGSGCIAGNEGCCGLWVLASLFAGAATSLLVLLIGKPKWHR